MTVVSNFFQKIWIRSGLRPDLIFFALLCLASCNQREGETLSVVLKDGKAVAISLPRNLVGRNDDDALIRQNLQLTKRGNATAILGDIVVEDGRILFEPVLPLTEGREYSVNYSGKLIGNVSVPSSDTSPPPEVLGLFPTTDTVPENLLKMYFRFSAPMREGEALQHIFLLGSSGRDTLKDTFLDLQPELWNKERTVLTLWLDPGRIKRDLIPNKKMGNPLSPGKYYEVIVSADWEDGAGVALAKVFSKKIFVQGRDSLGPEPGSWNIISPKPGTTEGLIIQMGEKLDYYLINETITIWYGQTQMSGRMNITHDESRIEFIPDNKWEAGTYILRVASALEDLAGNNLNRPFDRDMLTTKEKPRREYDSVMFKIGGSP